MYVASLQTWHFRNLAAAEIEFGPGTSLLAGENGQGKTSVLEAIYCASFSKSFRTHRLEECVTHGQHELRTGCRIWTETWPCRLEVRLGPPGKELRLDDKPVGISEFLEHASILCITADYIRIITEGPESRRRFFDGLLAQLWPAYIRSLAEYRRVIRQKNALLKGGAVRPAVLDPWNRKLVQSAQPLVERRLEFLRRLREAGAGTEYFSGEPLEIRYVPSLGPDALAHPDNALGVLETHREREIALERSLYGPHLDRYELLLGGRSVRHYASSGQKRSVLMSLYFRVMEIFRQERGRLPVVMLDDVDLELDPGRIRRLLEFLDGKTQLFLTTSKPDFMTGLLPDAQVFRVRSGAVLTSS